MVMTEYAATASASVRCFEDKHPAKTYRTQNNTLVAQSCLQAADNSAPLPNDFPAAVFQLTLVAAMVNPLLWVPTKTLEIVHNWETSSILNTSAGVFSLFEVIIVVFPMPASAY